MNVIEKLLAGMMEQFSYQRSYLRLAVSSPHYWFKVQFKRCRFEN